METGKKRQMSSGFSSGFTVAAVHFPEVWRKIFGDHRANTCTNRSRLNRHFKTVYPRCGSRLKLTGNRSLPI